MSSEKPNIGFNIVVVSTLGVIISIGLALGHGDEVHDSTTPIDLVQPDNSAPVPNAALDSIYALTQSEFAVLQPVFKKGCFDCHTTKTEFPWYYKLPVVKGMIDSDIAEAKKHMDMSDGFPFGGHGKPADDLVAIRVEVVEGKMPPMSYRLMHWNAKPSDSERDSVVTWVERSLARLASIGVFPTESRDSTNSAE
jgi:hypothetical protein